ncbi:MAG: hypothetical protein H7211_10190 [Aquabacterium sp.]|nr:hypothetical protein [Ferruginibacter sp.]
MVNLEIVLGNCSLRLREGLQWKAHSHEVRVARTWNGKPGPPSGGARPEY